MVLGEYGAHVDIAESQRHTELTQKLTTYSSSCGVALLVVHLLNCLLRKRLLWFSRMSKGLEEA